MTNLTKRLIAGLALSIGVSLAAAPAFAAIPDGPGDLTTCVDVDLEGTPQCPHADPEPDPDDEIDDFTAEEPVDPPVVDDPAPVDDAIVTTPNFTG